ncbi:MAG TPA: transcriptional regulator [Pirellulaceae bacterium]|nr:transcriptional regulator [Pirellulaceae bacterium]
MTASPRFVAADVNELPTDIAELNAMIGALPSETRARIEPVLARVIDSTKRRRRILSLVQDALSQLRLDMKYLVFDLEATRRERDDYRERLRKHGEFGGSGEGGESTDKFGEGQDE